MDIARSFTLTDLSQFDPSKFFEEYHYYEPFDATKTYPVERFRQDFGYGDHWYKYELYTISDRNGQIKDRSVSQNRDDLKDRSFIVAKEELSEEELKELSQYCQCDYHIVPSLFRISVCPCCVGCLNSPFPQQHVINKTRQYRAEHRAEHRAGKQSSCILL
jgi:hypothetical protein